MRISRIEKKSRKRTKFMCFCTMWSKFLIEFVCLFKWISYSKKKTPQKNTVDIIYEKGTLCSWIAIRIFKCWWLICQQKNWCSFCSDLIKCKKRAEIYWLFIELILTSSYRCRILFSHFGCVWVNEYGSKPVCKVNIQNIATIRIGNKVVLSKWKHKGPDLGVAT